jgi:CheY-like chemotaxis protein
MGKRILVVDDTPLNLMVATAFLKRDGWQVEVANDGATALRLLAGDHGFDALLLDISMPGLGGEEVCRAVRADARTAGLPIVAYTAHALVEERERIMAAGFDDIVVKPAAMATLLATLIQAVTKRSGG